MKQDRLSEAAEIRERIHAFVNARQGTSLSEIVRIVPDREYDTVGRILSLMCRRGYLRVSGKWPGRLYHAVGKSAGGSEPVRERLRELVKSRAHKKPRKPRRDEPPKPLSEPGIVRNFSAYKAAIPNQGGQGVVAARPRMSSVMGSLG